MSMQQRAWLHRPHRLGQTCLLPAAGLLHPQRAKPAIMMISCNLIPRPAAQQPAWRTNSKPGLAPSKYAPCSGDASPPAKWHPTACG